MPTFSSTLIKLKNLLRLILTGNWNGIFARLLKRRIIYSWYVKETLGNHKPIYEKELNTIYLMGLQGGGISFIARILKRHHQIYNAVGNNKYWMSYDEIANVYEEILPSELAYARIQKHLKKFPESILTKYENYFDFNPTWAYASSDLLKIFRSTEVDYSDELRSKYLKLLNHLKDQNSDSTDSYLLDKSQINSIKIPLLNRIMQGNTKMILVVRNPYVMIWRAVNKLKLPFNNNFDLKERYRIASEHYNNSINIPVKDLSRLNIDHKIVKYEDIMNNPEYWIKALCEFISISYSNNLFPSVENKVHFGALDVYKWWKFDGSYNDRYLNQMNKMDISYINDYIDIELVTKFDYTLL